MKNILALFCGVLLFAGTSYGKPEQPIFLWPGIAPGETNGAPAEGPLDKVVNVAGKPITRISNVSRPTITVFQPHRWRKNGAAVLVFPGGGFSFLSWDLEGTEVCNWLKSIGVTAFLVKYRVPRGEKPPLQDAQRAMGIIRKRAREFGVDPHRIGVLGFSAGGFVAANLCAHSTERAYPTVDDADSLSCRPDFQMLLYPGKLAGKPPEIVNPAVAVTSNTPPTFMVMAMNDPIGVSNVLAYATALQEAHAPAEIHLYANGGHGFGLRPNKWPITKWPALAREWLENRGLLKRP
jgi:acetyl esterase/lipase